MRLLLLWKKRKSWICLRPSNTLASLCWLHAGNICYSNFATISNYGYWDPVFNADSIGFEAFLWLAFCPTANEQLRDCKCLASSGFPSGRVHLSGRPDRCRRLGLLTNSEWAPSMWEPAIWSICWTWKKLISEGSFYVLETETRFSWALCEWGQGWESRNS